MCTLKRIYSIKFCSTEALACEVARQHLRLKEMVVRQQVRVLTNWSIVLSVHDFFSRHYRAPHLCGIPIIVNGAQESHAVFVSVTQ